MRILHLSDTHIDHAGAPNRHGVDTTGSLRGMLADVRHLAGLSAVVVSGDLADSGAPEEYAVVRDLVGAFARERGIPVFRTTGNHDERGAFAKALGSGRLDPAGGDRAEDRLGSPHGPLFHTPHARDPRAGETVFRRRIDHLRSPPASAGTPTPTLTLPAHDRYACGQGVLVVR
ncbi:metallophosphoesterase [Streptomyces sp. NBC_01538]|uniref:metallophosphoesterase n=1 Tax=Streptomyces sp. NBC_01538 TaxID=2903897 RepID=UPI003862E993